jgi:SpoVK/Ycf46/Vps4 family AAA+-type ATPase
LGTSAESVEARLPGIFQRASRWKALLLLDEADVYLEQRSPSEIIRNAIVCVFLRTLEYYQGIMFLTTNRVAHIDDAIASRIQFKINYSALSADQRRKIWEGFLTKAVTSQGLPDKDSWDLEDLVRKELNGRDVSLLPVVIDDY